MSEFKSLKIVALLESIQELENQYYRHDREQFFQVRSVAPLREIREHYAVLADLYEELGDFILAGRLRERSVLVNYDLHRYLMFICRLRPTGLKPKPRASV